MHMMIDSQQIARQLAGDIRELPHGTRLPSEQQLARRFSVRRSIVRSALDTLDAQHLVRRSRGVGTFVNHRLELRIGNDPRPSLRDHAHVCDRELDSKLISVTPVPLPESLAVNFDTDTGTELMCAQRLQFLDQEPALLYQTWFGADTVPHPEVALRVIPSVLEVLERADFSPQRVWSRVSIDPPPDQARAHLGLPYGSQVGFVESILRDATSGQPLVASRLWARLDLVRLVSEGPSV